MATVLDRVAEDAAKGEIPYVKFLDKLLEEEVAIRLARTVEMRTKLARFPFIKTMDTFDFGFQPSIDERLVRELACLRFIANAENVMFLGPARRRQDAPGHRPGTGCHRPGPARLLPLRRRAHQPLAGADAGPPGRPL